VTQGLGLTNSFEFIQKFRELKQDILTHNEIYTDGSKDQNKVASAVVRGNDIFSVRLPNNTSMFTAEAKALHILNIKHHLFRLFFLSSSN
jgi:hypothetical protein